MHAETDTKVDLTTVREFIGDVPEEAFKFIDANIGKNLYASYPNGGIFEYVTNPHAHPSCLFAIMSHRMNYLEYNGQLIAMRPNELLSIYPGTIHSEVPLDFQSRYLVVALKKHF